MILCTCIIFEHESTVNSNPRLNPQAHAKCNLHTQSKTQTEGNLSPSDEGSNIEIVTLKRAGFNGVCVSVLAGAAIQCLQSV